MSRTALEAHASACREAVLLGWRLPRWEGGSLTGARLSGADLTWTHLSGADLARAILTGADLSFASLTGATLTGVDLSGAYMRCTDLTGADLAGAHLSGADLTWAHLSGADLSGARIAEGVARGRAIGRESGGSRWWAVALEGGDVVLQCGLKRNILRWWLTEGHRFYSPEYWEHGPAVAIAAAQALTVALGDQE